jgi:hypothetical protein
MFTRDISLEDCILDLIDNSIDSLLRTQQIDIEKQVFRPEGKRSSATPVRIKVTYSDDEFRIEDNCGGIGLENAREDIFCFGHREAPSGKLGVYGIGLKRAIFKLGNWIEVESHTLSDGFRVTIDVLEWKKKDDDIAEDWKFPLVVLKATTSEEKAGTTIIVTQLRKEVRNRLREPTLERALHLLIAQTYSVFLDSSVEVLINGKKVQRQPIPFGKSPDLKPGFDRFEEQGVRVTLAAMLASRDENGEWPQEVAGWYVLCNGRVVVNADQTELTGWGTPAFVSKYRGFIGIALFVSKNPLALPWTTSKRGVNREAGIYQSARNRMKGLARPVLTFLNKMYPGDLLEEPAGRAIAESVQTTDFRLALKSARPGPFTAKDKRAKKTTTRVQYDAELRDLARVRKRLQEPAKSASDIGKYTFEYFLKVECAE